MYVKLAGREVEDVRLRIYEPPRFFEALLRGRAFTEAPDITSRICGICPIAYQMSAVRAMEDALRRGDRRRTAARPAPAHLLRRVDREPQPARLHAPRARLPRLRGRHRDGARPPRDRRAGAADEEDRQRGHDASSAAARSTRSTSASAASTARPRAASCARCVDPLERARETALATVRWTAELAVPGRASATPSSSRCREPGAYPIDLGRIVSDRGLDIAPAEFVDHIVEEHVEHSNALHARMRARGSYLTGPLARYSLASAALWPLARDAARAGRPRAATAATRSRASSCAASSSCRPATRRSRSSTATRSRTARRSRSSRAAASATAPPRRRAALLYHRYEIDDDGTILERDDRPADLAEPAPDRGGPARRRRAARRPPRRASCGCAASRRSATTTRASRARRTSSTSRSSVADAVLVVGVGNAFRGDDAAGLGGRAAAARARDADRRRGARARGRGDRAARPLGGRAARSCSSTPSAPVRRPGTVHRIDASDRPAARRPSRGSSSTHAVGVGDAIELARDARPAARAARRLRRRGARRSRRGRSCRRPWPPPSTPSRRPWWARRARFRRRASRV